MMKKIIIYIGISFFFILFSGCDSFLEEEPKSFSSAPLLFQSEGGIEQVLMGVYRSTSNVYAGRTYVMLFGITSDELNFALTNATRIELEKYVFTSQNSEITSFYNNSIYSINRANILLEYLPENPEFSSPDFINRVRAESRFLRAWNYFNLVRAMGPVPLVTNYEEAELYPHNSTIPQIYNQIIEDLSFAENNLPHWQEIGSAEKGRLSKGAATAALGLVYLTKASSEASENDDYSNAKSKLKEVIDNEGYDLWDNYFDAFHPDNENGKEDIFSMQFEANIRAHSMHADFSPSPDIYGQDGYQNFPLTDFLYNTFNAEDDRLIKIFKGEYRIDVEGDDNIYVTPNNKAFTQKYADPHNRNRNNHGTNFPVLRYSNILLLYAEVENELNGPTNEAYWAFNKVRVRSNLSELSDLSKDEFRIAIRDERFKELHAEGIRWFDLRRWGILKERIENIKGITVTMPKHKFFPIPQSEIDANPNLTQNEGY